MPIVSEQGHQEQRRELQQSVRAGVALRMIVADKAGLASGQVIDITPRVCGRTKLGYLKWPPALPTKPPIVLPTNPNGMLFLPSCNCHVAALAHYFVLCHALHWTCVNTRGYATTSHRAVRC
jgi:hypothetical protein